MTDATAATGHVHATHHPPISVYMKVWGWLFVLSVASYLVDIATFAPEWIWVQWTLITLFALAKATLILQYFMHLKWERLALVGAVLLLPLTFVAILVVFVVWEASWVDGIRGGLLGG